MTIATASNNAPTVIVSENGQQGIKGTDGSNGTGFNSVRKALLDNPLCHLFKTNKLVQTLAGALTTNRATTRTYRDRYGVVKTATINTLREEKDGWLIEGASTNLSLYSEQIDNAAWAKTGTSVTVNAIDAPDGNLTADLLLEDITTGVHRIFQTSTVSLGVDVTISFYVKPNGRTSNGMFFSSGESTVFNLTTKVITEASGSKNSKIEVLGNGWFRISTTITTSTTTFTYQLRLHNGSTSVYTGDGVSGSYVFGSQLEELPFSSSYIPTTTTAATRAADIDYIQINNNFLSGKNSNHSMFMRFKALGNLSLTKLLQTTQTSSLFYHQLQASGLIEYFDGSSTRAIHSTTHGNLVDIVTVTNNSVLTIYINGVAGMPITITPTQNLDETLQLYIGSNNGINQFFYGHIKDLRIYDFALNADEVQYLSGV